MKRLIIDLDNTICESANGEYANAVPKPGMAEKLAEYSANGFTVVIHTSRNMRTYSGNVGLITAKTVPLIVSWLEKNNIPYDEICVGKPWCGSEGFYIDDRAIRPAEFLTHSYAEILNIIESAR